MMREVDCFGGPAAISVVEKVQITNQEYLEAVSYTHLDVYKRQYITGSGMKKKAKEKQIGRVKVIERVSVKACN